MEMGNLQKISQFALQTGTSHKLAQEILQENDWNLEKAVKMYKYMSQVATLPSGSQKNMENLQGNWRAASVRPFPPSTNLQSSNAKAPGEQIKSDVTNGQVSNNSPSNTLNRRIKRGISTTANDAQIISIARDMLHTVQENEANSLQGYFETPEYTFILPDISHYPDDFKAFLNKDLIETSTLVSLEQAGRLNWWADVGVCQRLLPLATTGDGNCLLHAASLALWGFHDRLLTLRKALCQTMTSSNSKTAFFRRWRWHQTQINKQSGLVYSEQEWLEEWNNLAKLASAQPRIHPVAGPNLIGHHSPTSNSRKCSSEERESVDDETEVLYESLEELHVFVLAHILRRTIIIIADTILKDSNGEALAPISFGGIYMPLECDASECHHSPLLLTYDAAHFSALVPMEDSNDSATSESIQLAAAIPLVDADFELLPLHFTVDPGVEYDWKRADSTEGDDMSFKVVEMSVKDRLNLLQKYLDVEQLPLPFIESVSNNGTSEKTAAVEEDLNNGNSQSDSIGRTMSLESEDSSLSASNGKEKTITNGKERYSNGKGTELETDVGWEKKKKDRGKLRNFVRSVGTLRRTLSRTFSRNFCASAKSGRRSEAKSEVMEKHLNSKSLVQQVSLTTTTAPVATKTFVSITEWKGSDQLLCARLQHKRLDFQEEMIISYLKSAAERFQQEKDVLRQQDAELRHLTERRRQELELVHCVNTGCEGKASAATCYLCQDCFERQKQEEFDMKMMRANSPPSSSNYEASKIDRVDSGPSLSHYVPPGGIPHTQKHPVNGRPSLDCVSYNAKPKGYVMSNKNTSILRSRSQEEAIRNSFPNNGVGVGGGGGGRCTVMNNVRPSSGSTPPNCATEVSHHLFYDTHDNCKTQMTRSSTIPAGTAVIVNNLYPSDEEATVKTSTHLGPNINLNCEWENLSEPLKYSQLGDISNANIANTCPGNDHEYTISPWVSRDNLAMLSVQQKCKTYGCDYYGTEATELLCSACFREKANRRNAASLVSNKVVR